MLMRFISILASDKENQIFVQVEFDFYDTVELSTPLFLYKPRYLYIFIVDDIR